MGMSTEPRRESKKPTGSAGRTARANPARAAMQRSRRVVPGGVVDKARSGTRGVTDKLDVVAKSTTTSGRSAAGGLATTAGTAADTAKGVTTTTAGTAKGGLTATAGIAKGAVTTVAGKVLKPVLSGVAFALIVRKVMLFIQFLRQLALQLLEALKQLALRLREVAARLRGGDEHQVIEGEESGENRDERPEPAAPPRSEGRRPVAARPDAPAERRRAPAARRPERPGGRAPRAGGPR
jgi:hypothetical protein